MGQILHGSATTTEAVRRAIQHSQESLRGLAKRYGVNPKTVAKWKARTSVSDLPTGPKQPRSTVLSAEEEAVVVAFRRHTLLPLDDCLYALQPTLPHLTRSSLHRCLQRNGISRLPQVEGEASAKRKFKAYPIGYFHIDIAEVRTAQGKLYLIVAIDRTSKFAFVEMHEKVARRTAGDFLRRLIAAVPYRVHTVLTDNGTHFTTPGNTSSAAPDIKAALEAGELVWAHAFEYACAQNDIDHRLTKPKHPWTTDVIDKCFFAGSELFSSRARATAWRRAGREAQALPRSLHRRPSVAAPVRACLGPRGFQPATKRAYAVSACSTHLRS
jgi:transposase